MSKSLARISAIAILCVTASLGCSRSDEAEIAKLKAEVEAAKAEAQAAKAEAQSATAQVATERSRADSAETELAKLRSAQTQPMAADVDRRAAEWVMRVDGSLRAIVEGVPQEIKKGDKLPDGQIKLVAINLLGCPKATDEGREYLRGLNHLQELAINDGARIRNLDFLADMADLQVLNCEGGNYLVTDKDLDYIKQLSNLKTLVLISQAKHNSELTDKALEVAKHLKQLEVLRLGCCDISDAGLRHLEGHESLRHLDFWRTKISDAGLESLVKLPKLKNLYLASTQVTDAGVKAFQEKKPMCMVKK